MENNSDRSIALHSWHGGGLLLEILGGLVVGAAIASASSFINFLLLPFSVDSVGQPVTPSSPALLLGIVTYFCFLSTSFRQVHGLAIVLPDNDFQTEVGTRLTQRKRVMSFVCAVTVLAITGILLAIVTSEPNDPIRVLLASLQQLGIFPATVILVFHFLTVLSYWMWDLVSRDIATTPDGSDGPAGFLGLRWGATSYREFSSNWMRMANISFAVLLVTGLLYFFLIDDGAVQDPRLPLPWKLSLLAIVGLAISTLGYSIVDYVCNAHFYFRECPLTVLKNKNSQNAERNNMTLRQGYYVFGSTTVFCSFLLSLVWATAVSSAPDPHVTLQLKWLYNAGFTGDLVAEQHGVA